MVAVANAQPVRVVSTNKSEQHPVILVTPVWIIAILARALTAAVAVVLTVAAVEVAVVLAVVPTVAVVVLKQNHARLVAIALVACGCGMDL